MANIQVHKTLLHETKLPKPIVQKKSVMCFICNSTLPRYDHLEAHMRRHTGERPYHCKFCPTSTTQSSALKVHERIHTGEKRFDCEFCKKKFASLAALTGHVRVHTTEKTVQVYPVREAFW